MHLTHLLSISLLAGAGAVFGSPLASYDRIGGGDGGVDAAEIMIKRQWDNVDWPNFLNRRSVPFKQEGREGEEHGLAKRIVFNPHITSPKGGEQFTAGEKVTVEWDTSDIPKELTSHVVSIQLGFIRPDGKGAYNLQKPPLAKSVPLDPGQYTVTLPTNLESRDDYILIVFGDSGNKSEKFSIKKAAATTAGDGGDDKVKDKVKGGKNQEQTEGAKWDENALMGRDVN